MDNTHLVKILIIKSPDVKLFQIHTQSKLNEANQIGG